MLPEIKTISLPMSVFGSTNCYLVKTDTGYILIDTGFPSRRAELEQGLTDAGCQPGNLNLIVITHSDPDHVGNCAYLHDKYSVPGHPVKIAMHRCEAPVVENGDETQNRRRRPFLDRLIGGIILKVLGAIINFGKFERFQPDFYLDEGDGLSAYGLDAKILVLPGHSRGSIGILTTVDDSATGPAPVLFCGDLLWNMRKPGPHSIVDDATELNASIERVKSLGIQNVYPGHGASFSMAQLTANTR